MEAELLNGKVLRLAIEDHNAAAMSAWRRHRRHSKAAGFLRVKFVGESGFLQ